LINGLDSDDPLIDFILQQLVIHNLIEQTSSGYAVKYSRIVPPERWSPEEHQQYVENILSNLKDVVSKDASKKMGAGSWTGEISEAQFMAFAESQIAAGNSLLGTEGPMKFQFTFIIKQL
jgi:hypothetical protein